MGVLVVALCLTTVLLAAASLWWAAGRLAAVQRLLEDPAVDLHHALVAQNDVLAAEVDRRTGR